MLQFSLTYYDIVFSSRVLELRLILLIDVLPSVNSNLEYMVQ